MKYFAKIKYLGSAFHGFQVQPDKRTVQGELCEALRLATGVPCKVTGCSRTDAGVHANEFCITVDAEGATVPADKLSIAVSRFLPDDLSLFWAKECDDDFHPRYDVKSKEYLYRIRNQKIYDPFEVGRAWFPQRTVSAEGIFRMQKAAVYFIGKHDFSTFMSEGSDITDCVRTVFDLSVLEKDGLIEIRISADGFLYNMVRIIVGTLVDYALGKISLKNIKNALERGLRSEAGQTMQACGLYLKETFY